MAPSGFGIGIVAAAQNSDKDESRMIRSALRVMDGNRIPGVIDEELFASLVLVAEHHVQTTAPAMVEFAEAAVAEALGMVSVGIPPTGVAASGDG